MKDIEKLLQRMSLKEKAQLCIDGALWRTREFSDLGIPILSMSDGTNGVRYIKNQRDIDPEKTIFRTSIRASLDTEEGQNNTNPATCFPTGSAMACSWNVDLAREVAAAVANECKSYGIGMLFGPGMNTRRHPLDGRGFEYFSEDPCLAGEMAGHYVAGLQQHEVAGTLKHFVCNNSNYMRTSYDCVVEERALREIYLAAFERAIQVGKPAAIMISYNLLNGIQACENKWLLTDVVRKDWNYDGLLISDSSAVKDYLAAFNAGLDWEMPYSVNAAKAIEDGVRSGKMDAKVLDAHCRRILMTVQKYSREGKALEAVDYAQHHKLAQKAASECAVLLKNERNLLPLKPDAYMTIAVLGMVAEKPVFQGSGCACVPAKTVDSPLQEIRLACQETTQVVYMPGYDESDNMSDEGLQAAVKAAVSADVAIVFAAARLPLETDDYNRKDMRLVASHDKLIEEVAKAQKNTIVILNNGEAVELPWADRVSSILDMWYTGEGSGKAVADLIFGKENPSGKLAVSMPYRLEDTPAYFNFPGENHRIVYGEGIYVGYRYYEKKKIPVRYPFGHGLSYTNFTYSNLLLSKACCRADEPVTVTFDVTNTGSCSGAEVVQCYIRDTHSRLPRPEKELKHFAKVYLDPGETKQVRFDLSERDFSYYDTEFGGWIADSGEFEVLIAASSNDIRLSQMLQVVSNQHFVPLFKPDSHFLEIFSNAKSREVFYHFLIEHGELLPEDMCAQSDTLFETNFWGMEQYLDYMLPSKITPEMMRELADKMNKAAQE